jgi:hypothetical protein
MGQVASCLSRDTCCQWCPVLDVAGASAAAAAGFVAAEKASVMKAVVLRVSIPASEGLL